MDFGHDVVRAFMPKFRFKDAFPDAVLEPFMTEVIKAVSNFDIDAFMEMHPGSSLWRADDHFKLFGNSVSGRVRAFIAQSIYERNLELLNDLLPFCTNFEEFGWNGWAETLGRIHDTPYHQGIEPIGLKGVEELTTLGLLEHTASEEDIHSSLLKFSTKGYRTYNTISSISPRPGVEPTRAYILR
jgi:hypothetical protein